MRPRDPAFTGAFALIVSAVACAIVAIAAPRPVEPRQLPALRLDPDAVAQQARDDRQLGRHLPRGPDVTRLLRLQREEFAAELAPETDFAAQRERRAQLQETARVLFARLDAQAARALMVDASERAIRALHARVGDVEGHVLDADERALLGDAPRLLARYGYIDVEGALRAPALALRAFFAARFNLTCARPLLAGFSRLERIAHTGWSALHAGALEPEQRAQAAREYHALGGRDGAEADAIWRYHGGAASEARALLEAEYVRTGSLRLRNMALYVARDRLD